jgi:hypothetical protein
LKIGGRKAEILSANRNSNEKPGRRSRGRKIKTQIAAPRHFLYIELGTVPYSVTSFMLTRRAVKHSPGSVVPTSPIEILNCWY